MNVIDDITGVTGLKIIRAILNGERSPEKLASYRDGRCKMSEEVIAKSLKGNYREVWTKLRACWTRLLRSAIQRKNYQKHAETSQDVRV